MEYFVQMRTHVPDGTPAYTVEAVRDREAARARELAAEGHLLRLWRPPPVPGEWQTFGLFVAQDSAQLDGLLSSMPLHVWRSDEVTPLGAHPNDPGAISGRESSEFLTELTITVPDGTPTRQVEELNAGEAVRARELAEQGRMLRLWTLPSVISARRVLGLWSAHDSADLTATLKSLPLYLWMTIDPTPLLPHPSDPMVGVSR
jgi:muconolactone delta-isomerase